MKGFTIMNKKILLFVTSLLALNSLQAYACSAGSLSPSTMSNCRKICEGDSEPWRTLCYIGAPNPNSASLNKSELVDRMAPTGTPVQQWLSLSSYRGLTLNGTVSYVKVILCDKSKYYGRGKTRSKRCLFNRKIAFNGHCCPQIDFSDGFSRLTWVFAQLSIRPFKE